MNPRPVPPTAAEAKRFEAIALPQADAAYTLALRLTRQAEAAEDVVHEAYLSALNRFSDYRGGDPRAWILTIVRHKAYDWLRERARKPTVSLSALADDLDEDFDIPDLSQETAEQALIRKGDAAGMQAAIDTLPPRLREVLLLREMEALSYRQIAEITDAPIGSVMSRLARARTQLGEIWRRLQDKMESRA